MKKDKNVFIGAPLEKINEVKNIINGLLQMGGFNILYDWTVAPGIQNGASENEKKEHAQTLMESLLNADVFIFISNEKLPTYTYFGELAIAIAMVEQDRRKKILVLDNEYGPEISVLLYLLPSTLEKHK